MKEEEAKEKRGNKRNKKLDECSSTRVLALLALEALG